MENCISSIAHCGSEKISNVFGPFSVLTKCPETVDQYILVHLAQQRRARLKSSVYSRLFLVSVVISHPFMACYRLNSVSGCIRPLQNTLGCLVTAGPTYTYVDLITDNNATYMDDPLGTGMGQGAGDEWETRFNINFEYYL